MNLYKLIVRILAKQRQLFVFSIISLSVSMMLAILAFAHLANELSCDKHNRNIDRTYRLVNSTFNEVGLEDKFYNNLISNFPAIDKVCRFYKAGSMISVDENVFNIDNLIIVDSTFFKVFDYSILTGNAEHLLNAPNKIVLSKSLAQKMFGTQNPIGKPVKVNMMVTAYVTGVFDGNHNKSHFDADAIVSLYTTDLPSTGGSYWNNEGSWEIKKFSFYITIKEKADTLQLGRLIRAQYKTPWEREVPNIILQPLESIYWNNEIKDYSGHANLPLIILLISIAVIVLIIAAINYINLSLSNLKAESKIVSVFKMHGAQRINMLTYYALSGLTILGISFIVAVLLSILCLPLFNQLIQSNISFAVFRNSNFLIPFIGCIAFVFIVIGFYPAILFSRISPISLFQGKVLGNFRLSAFSKILLIFQFIVAIVLITSVILIFKQINFMKNQNPGFETSYLINQDFHYSIKEKSTIEAYTRELLKNPDILNFSVSEGIPLDVHMYSSQQVNNFDVSYMQINCDTSYLNLLGLKLIEGRYLLPSDNNSCVITRKLAVDCGFEEPINEKIGSNEIVGVVDNINAKSLHYKIEGVMFALLTEKPSDLTIKISSSNIPKTIAWMKKLWEQFFPAYPFNYTFYDEIIANQYNKEQNLAKSITIIACLAVFLCCLGLLGLLANVVESRVKEIGIRKASGGAKTLEIMLMLNKDYIIWIAIAFVIACPITWYAMNSWLQNFVYKTELSWWIFALAGLITLFIALITVSWQAWRAAARNPVEALRSE